MPYPNSPFGEDFDVRFLLKSRKETFGTPAQIQIQNGYLEETLKWICTSPSLTSVRVNTLRTSVDEFYTVLYKQLSEQAIASGRNLPNIAIHPVLKEVIILENWAEDELNLQPKKKEIMVDVHCGAAILRGSHIFAPGVLGMLSGVQIGDEVSVYVDLSKKCKRGLQKVYNPSEKLFVGNGTALMNRSQLFNGNHTPLKGVAVKITDTTSGCVQTEGVIPLGVALLHNLPSIICVYVLDPQANDVVLDMCAAPGNKTTHIAAYTKNMCTLVALDKTPTKVKTLKENCDNFGASATAFQADSTKILTHLQEEANKANILEGPPYAPETFDKILLDAPCSALGKRPQLAVKTSVKELTSYVPLQRKLFENAVGLLKTNGTLVYSTCTITLAENEGLVSWALKRFPNLRLEKAEPFLGEPGLDGADLSDSQRSSIQRFGPHSSNDVDSVGFFVAKFVKTAPPFSAK